MEGKNDSLTGGDCIASNIMNTSPSNPLQPMSEMLTRVKQNEEEFVRNDFFTPTPSLSFLLIHFTNPDAHALRTNNNKRQQTSKHIERTIFYTSKYLLSENRLSARARVVARMCVSV